MQSQRSTYLHVTKWSCLYSKCSTETVTTTFLNKDIFRHLMLERDNMMVYPTNNLRAVELFKCERGDRIDR